MIRTKTETELVDDLDHNVRGGSVATRAFCLGGDVRHIELSDENWDALLAAVKPFLDVSRKAGKSAAVRKGRVAAASPDAAARAFNRAAREWAIENGRIDPATSRGRLSDALKQEYRATLNGETGGQPAHDPDQIPAF